MPVTVGYDGLYLDGQRVPLFSAALHYWRLERHLWPAILDNVRAMGFRVVETYIPWGVHEQEQSVFDFQGDRDLEAFLSLCEDKGFYLLVRPGPHINAELTYFGYPRRVLLDPEVQALTADGVPAILAIPPKPFPIPSYASEKFYGEVALWFDTVCPVLAGHLYPRGGILAVQADNELSYFFRWSPYDLDYAPGSVQLYREFLRDRYGELAALNESYRTQYSLWGEINPPREFRAGRREKLPYYLDWARYKEYYLVYGLERIAGMLRQRGIGGVPLFHNYPIIYPRVPFNIVQSEGIVDVQGIDIYAHKEYYEEIRSGVAYTATTSRMPFIPELGCGAWAWHPGFTLEEERFRVLAALMHGIKAANFYMIVERERWIGSPITRDNRLRPERFEFYRSLNRVLEESGLADFRKQTDVLLLANRDYDRLEYACQLLSPPGPGFGMLPGVQPELLASSERFGFQDVIQAAKQDWWEAFYRGLAAAHWPFGLSDTELPLERLRQHPVVIVSTFDFLSAPTQEKLVTCCEGGGTLIVGPRSPFLDESMQQQEILARLMRRPVGRVAQAEVEGVPVREADFFEAAPLLAAEGKAVAYMESVGRGRLVHLGFLPPRIRSAKEAAPFGRLLDQVLRKLGLEKPVAVDDPEVDLALHWADGRRILFAANPTDQARSVSVKLRGPFRLRDLWTGEEWSGVGEVTGVMKPWMVKMWEVF